MVKYHISESTGEPSVCTAHARPCPVGGDHYGSEGEAREAFERTMKAYEVPPAGNPHLPANAISTTALKKGMKITRPFDPDKTVYEVDRAVVSGTVVTVYTTSGKVLSANTAGTYRLAE